MLAGWGPPEGGLAAWAAEPKFDGWRVLVTVDDRVTVRIRRGHTLDVPELASLGDLGLRVVLDGELVASAGRMR
jgi:ATP-dependent DNA ligase